MTTMRAKHRAEQESKNQIIQARAIEHLEEHLREQEPGAEVIVPSLTPMSPMSPTHIVQPAQAHPSTPAPPPPTRRDREIALKELELQAIKSYMGERHQNTHITPDERLILSILHHDLALNPWAVSRNICHQFGIPFDDKEFEIDFLKDFIMDYLDFGLPLDRKGRSEVKDIFQAYFAGEQEQEKKQEKLIT